MDKKGLLKGIFIGVVVIIIVSLLGFFLLRFMNSVSANAVVIPSENGTFLYKVHVYNDGAIELKETTIILTDFAGGEDADFSIGGSIDLALFLSDCKIVFPEDKETSTNLLKLFCNEIGMPGSFTITWESFATPKQDKYFLLR